MLVEIVLPPQLEPKPKILPKTEEVTENALTLEIEEQTVIVAEVIGSYSYPQSGYSYWGLNPKNLDFTDFPGDLAKMCLQKKVNKEGTVFSLSVSIEVEDPDGKKWYTHSKLKVNSAREVKDYPHI